MRLPVVTVILLASVLLAACSGGDDEAARSQAELEALREDVAALSERLDAVTSQVEAVDGSVAEVAAETAAAATLEDVRDAIAEHERTEELAIIVVGKRTRVEDMILLPDSAGRIVGNVVPYCVTYTIAGATQEKCIDAPAYDDADRADPQMVAQGVLVRDCWARQTEIGELLADCWR